MTVAPTFRWWVRIETSCQEACGRLRRTLRGPVVAAGIELEQGTLGTRSHIPAATLHSHQSAESVMVLSPRPASVFPPARQSHAFLYVAS